MKFETIEKSNINSTQVGFPDELTTPEFLNKLYANLSLTGEEQLYNMSQQLKGYSDLIFQEKYNPTFVNSLSEKAKEIFKKCGLNRKITWEYYDQLPCILNDDSKVFHVKQTLYPVFHPERPYYVNLAYLLTIIRPHKRYDFEDDMQEIGRAHV